MLAAAALAMTLATGACAATKTMPMTTLHTWLVPWDMASSGEDLCFDEIRPFAFAFSSDDAVVAAYPELLVAARARRRDGPFIPVVVNDVVENEEVRTLKSPDVLRDVLSDGASISAHIDALLALARDFDGLEIDYERVPPPLWGRYVEFISRLSSRLHAEGKKLYVDIEPGLLYDRHWPERFGRRIATDVDAFDLMDYYERGDSGPAPGPGASQPWATETARRALAFVPKDKLVIVLSTAGMDWTEDLAGIWWHGERLNYGQTMKLLLESSGEIGWDEEAACPYFRTIREGRPHQIWFENERSLSLKIASLRALGAQNFGLWYWGRRHPDFKELGVCGRSSR